MKSTLDLRRVYHHLERRICTHVVLCWLALLLIRLAENATADTWRNLRHQLDRGFGVRPVSLRILALCGP